MGSQRVHNKMNVVAVTAPKPKPTEPEELFVPPFNSIPDFEVTILPNGWGVAILNITPELALEMLQRNYERQRKAKIENIKRYARDMESGHWELTHQGIAFDQAGELYDGQNRLGAIVSSGKTVPMLVFFGVGKAGVTREMEVIDSGKPRNTADAATIHGLEVNGFMVTLLNFMVKYGVENGSNRLRLLTSSDRVILLGKHGELLKKVEGWFGYGNIARKVGKGSVRAAVACAAFHVDETRLQTFVNILTDRVEPQPGEATARTLRQFIQAKDHIPELELFLKTCKAIEKFMDRVDDSRIYAASTNPYPPPTDFIQVSA